MSFVQVPSAPGSTGQNIESVVVTSSQHRQVFVLGDPVSASIQPVTTSGGGLVTITNPTTAVSLSSSPLVLVATSGGTISVNTLSSGPITISGSVVSASSGVVQTLTTGAYPVLTSGPLQVLTSGTLIIASASSGFVQTLTTGATVLSSAGATQVLTTGATVLSSVGVTQVLTSGATVLSSAGTTQVLMSTAVTNGTSVSHTLVTSGTPTRAIKTSAGKLFQIQAWSTAGSFGFLQIFNATTGSVSPGTTTPVLVIPIQAFTSAASIASANVQPWDSYYGVQFGTAISVTYTTTTTGSTVPAGSISVEAEFL